MAIGEFRIMPNGIHPLHLGMDREQVERVMGEFPTITESRTAGEEILRFDHANARVVMSEGRAVEISVYPPATVVFEGEALFHSPSAWRAVVASDDDPRECFGFIVLRQSRLTLTGFHDNDRSQLAVTAFAEGRWDALHDQMKPFAF